ncbi:MAG: methyltransferase [Candidatus Eisenbacteria bacterium]
MKPATQDDIHDLLAGHITSAALGAALELGLFWLLAEKPMDVERVARELSIPVNRCRYWLQLMHGIGLLERTPGGYAPSATARSAILDAYGRETWALLAEEERERFPAILNLAVHMREPRSVWEAEGRVAPDYFAQLVESPARARRFTRMLYEIHLPLACRLRDFLEMDGVRRMMDLGGGSGVVSLALVERYHGLTSVVVDVSNVCAAGREIAGEKPGGERVSYHEADFVRDELPAGFDMVLECDVGVCSEALFRKVHTVLNPGGRLVIVDQFAAPDGEVSPSRIQWEFRNSMVNPNSALRTVADIRALLGKTGYRVLSTRVLPAGAPRRWTGGWQVIEAGV